MKASRNFKWFIQLGLAFFLVSAAVYALFYVLFHDVDFIFHHFLIDLAFLPIDVFLVAVVFERLIHRREEAERAERMHLIIGSFFHEVGTDLVKSLAAKYSHAVKPEHRMSDTWTKADFNRLRKALQEIVPRLEMSTAALIELRDFLIVKREYLLSLMGNDNLMESERFSQLLLAIFHLFEELDLRKDLQNLTRGDREHLSRDIRRVYLLLNEQWIDYLFHLKQNYPYLFSLAVRTNPFDPEARVEVGEAEHASRA